MQRIQILRGMTMDELAINIPIFEFYEAAQFFI